VTQRFDQQVQCHRFHEVRVEAGGAGALSIGVLAVTGDRDDPAFRRERDVLGDSTPMTP
jgi:hypothetical protein